MITCVQFWEGPPPKIWEGQKNVQISERLRTTFDLIANISGTCGHVKNLKSTLSTTTPPRLDKRNLLNFGPHMKKLWRCILTHPSGHFSGHNISALKERCALKFLHALETDQGYLAHTPTGTGSPPQKKKLIARI